MDLVEQFITFCKGHLSPTSTVVVGVSGGMDSMVLLHLLLQALQRDADIYKSLCVVHVHHGLRHTADNDARFVEEFCKAHETPCRVVNVHVDVTAGDGMEAAARTARYGAFQDIARQMRNPVLMVAHHQMDQVETLLLRWLRGTGLHGLGAMRPVSAYADLPLLRPLLHVDHAIIAEYARFQQLPYVVDETNADLRFLRNDLRKHVVPELIRLQPELGRLTMRLTEQLQLDEDYLQEAAKQLVDKMRRNSSKTTVMLDRRPLMEAHVSLQRRAIHILLNCFTSHGWTYRHIENVLRIALQANTPSASQMLPHGLCVWRRYDHLYIGCTPSSLHAEKSDTQVWDVGESHRFFHESPSLAWRFWALRYPVDQPKGNLWRLWLPRCERLEVRFGVALDQRIRPLGLGGSKKLQDIFVDRKIPRDFRLSWPVFSLDGDIVWIPGVARSESHVIRQETREGCVILAHLSRADRMNLGHRMDNTNV